MIRIERGPAPAFLTDDNGLWKKEIESAITYYADKANTKPFKFKMYRAEQLKTALKEVFKKCAYCESRYGPSSDGDVEHFRPKLRVQGKIPETPGYFWLANDWDNLLLSCQHCNQGRKHILNDTKEAETPISVGKLDQFPLRAPGEWIQNHTAQLNSEEPHRLLLNPCTDQPEKHFSYDLTEGLMIPADDRASTSIEVYALRRILLVQERKTLLISLLGHLEELLYCLENFDNDPNQRNRDAVMRNWKFVNSFTANEANYAGMCRFVVKHVLKKNNIVPSSS
ncbi:hypothetical protein D3C87_1079630 [compost metagenome]